MKKDADGNFFFDLNTKKRVTVKEFRGKIMVDIREFYQPAGATNGESLPTKKGVCLTQDAWESLIKQANIINMAIEATQNDGRRR